MVASLLSALIIGLFIFVALLLVFKYTDCLITLILMLAFRALF